MSARPPFRGPLFLVGMPRSGTKLLRSLLNRSSRVGIPDVETELYPYWVGRWSGWGDLSRRENFSRFYAEVTRLPYFVYQAKLVGVIPEQEWYSACREYSPAGVFEALIRRDAAVPLGSDRIWGDKSPSYVHHLPMLKAHFPEARFLHIIRDARDHALSMKKAWGKHPIRAAQRWVDGVEAARRDARAFPESYVELRYEDLLYDPEPLVRRCCAHLEIEFDVAMLDPGKVTENLGDARGVKGLKVDNAEKWRTAMDPALREQIERISGPTLRSLGYPCDYPGPAERVSPMALRVYQAQDAVGLVKAEVAERGWIGALRFRIDTWRVSGNRSAGA